MNAKIILITKDIKEIVFNRFIIHWLIFTIHYSIRKSRSIITMSHLFLSFLLDSLYSSLVRNTLKMVQFFFTIPSIDCKFIFLFKIKILLPSIDYRRLLNIMKYDVDIQYLLCPIFLNQTDSSSSRICRLEMLEFLQTVSHRLKL